MKFLISYLGIQDFFCFWLGIGKSDGSKDIIVYVLGKFSLLELFIVEKSLDLVMEAIVYSLYYGIVKIMSLFNNCDVCFQVMGLMGYDGKLVNYYIFWEFCL